MSTNNPRKVEPDPKEVCIPCEKFRRWLKESLKPSKK